MAAVLTIFVAALLGAKLVVDVSEWFEMRDSILRELYESQRQMWVEIGRPRGRFWRPKDEESNPFGYLDHSVWRSLPGLIVPAAVSELILKQKTAAKKIVLIDVPSALIAALIAAFVYYGGTPS